jgi:hypothetical protein
MIAREAISDRNFRDCRTDDQGRYLLPDLPKANYDIWVRGYGLVDSPKVKSDPGKQVALKSVQAPNRAAAAQYYPGIYWYSMLHIPEANQFPGTGPNGNGMPTGLKDQGQWLRWDKTDGCIHCHQLGDTATRTFPVDFGKFNTSAERWERRIQSGQGGPIMIGIAAGLLGGANFKYLGDWTERVAKGELPKDPPGPGPRGVERNIVVTEWNLNTPTAYVRMTAFPRRARSARQCERLDLRLDRAVDRAASLGRSDQQQGGRAEDRISRSQDADDQDRSQPDAFAILGR